MNPKRIFFYFFLCSNLLSSFFIAYHLKVSIALIEICVGVAAAALANKYIGPDALGTVIALGLLFAPFTYKTIIFIAASIVVLAILPLLTSLFTNIYGNRTAAIRVKWVVLVLFGLGTLALWSGSEAVLPAYLAGIVLAEFATRNHIWIRRLRSLTVGFLTPFYFIRAGSLVALPALLP